IFDRVVYETTKDVWYECPFHTFIIETPVAILGLFPDTRDQDELKKMLVGTKMLTTDFQRLVYECVQQLLKLYRGERMAVPQAPHESWMVNLLWGFLADELHVPQCVTTSSLLVVEAAKKDEGPNVTKALDDGMKVCKLTKDMQDLKLGEAKHNVREHLVTFGGSDLRETATVTDFTNSSTRAVKTLPSGWVNQVGIRCVL
ncbi:hypothetical protein BGZ92_005704, partial [Podila epicladia]